MVLLRPDDGEALVGERAQFAIVYPPNELWDMNAIIGNLRWQMNERYWRAERYASAAGLAHADKLAAWVQQTRSTADDVAATYGDTVAQLMKDAAAAVAGTGGWIDERIENAPADPKGRADVFVTIAVWAFDKWRRAMEECGASARGAGVPGRDAGRLSLLRPAIEALAEIGAPTISDDAWKKRVRRLRIRSGEEDNLMAVVLESCRVGPFDADGRDNGAQKRA